MFISGNAVWYDFTGVYEETMHFTNQRGREKGRVVHELSGLDDPMINGQRQHIARDIHITPVERYAT